ncbi:mcfT [Acrasis kona]|uniref:McfT n=1 Tax=Acrasis kona TaxID=1008807 RepID=A0AAW2YK29_9EUKA
MAQQPQHHQPFSHHIIAGAIAGTSEILVMYPLDVVKTRAQLSTGTAKALPIFGTMKSIVKEHGIGRLYRGILPPILMEAPKRAVKFSSNETYKGWFSRNGKLYQSGAIASGMMAGVTEAFVVVPFELVKIRLQAKENAGLYLNTADAIKKIMKNEGPLAFYKGLESTIWRNAWWNGGYFGLIYYLKNTALPKANNETQEFFRNFISGAAAGTFGTMLNTPSDVVKTRIQNQYATLKPGDVPKYNWTYPSMALIYKEEGVKALYKGFWPKVLRLGPGGGILLVVFDYVTNFLKEH